MTVTLKVVLVFFIFQLVSGAIISCCAFLAKVMERDCDSNYWALLITILFHVFYLMVKVRNFYHGFVKNKLA